MAYTDGTWTVAAQDGDKQPTFPYDYLGDSYARLIVRPYMLLSGSYSAPGTLTANAVTNYLLRSEEFDNGSWTKVEVTITANQTANPQNGEVNADSDLETVTNSAHIVYQAYTALNAATVFSVYAKANGRNFIRLRYTDSGATIYSCFFNLSSGTVGTASGATGSILSCGNSWYRCSIVFTPTAGAGSAVYEISTDGSTTVYAGDVTKGLYLWGAQMERAASLGTYLPTTSATRTTTLRTTDLIDNASNPDPFAFLIQETAPETGMLRSGIAKFLRTYARVPKQEIDYGSAVITRPSMNGVNSGGSYGVSFDDGTTTHVFTSRSTVTVSVGTYAAPKYKVTQVAHGQTVGTRVAIWLNNSLLVSTTIYEVADADNYYVDFGSTISVTATTYYAGYGPSAAARYVNGAVNVSTKITIDSYYPGWSPGITTGVDVPIVATQLDPVSWLALIVAGTAYGCILASNLDKWNGGPIYQQQTTYCQMSDALETVSVNS